MYSELGFGSPLREKMTTCFLMIPPNGFVSAMSCRDIGGNGPPPRDTNPLPSLERVQSVRRRLPFGDVDHQQTHLDLQNQLRQCHEMDRNRYNFDFQSEQPINSSDSRYEWSHISSDDTQQDTNDTNISQEFSTKLCKTNDHESTQSSQSATSSPSQPPLLSPLLPPLPTLSDTGAHIVSSALASDPTSATFAPDSQPQASSSAVGLTLKVGHKKQIVSQSKQTKITGKN
ncbi:unnamed protein product [Medioppia subpectinata]|uniref:Cyclin-dependent kinase inhibitor domain-containing protein n=1 Tax=Medioppia subpectinata TaxID=1979941 RepID=A0A7R9L1V7_9ACAR|nr:unnamed protein product [Medioppia subpectinata]CAG2113697.1 unnamed protein product [Medioppia subpectinata]